MAKAGKSVALVILLVLVLFGAVADMPFFTARWHIDQWLGGLDRVLFLRLVGLSGLVIACFVAWGYKRKVETSQKFQRAKEVLAAAEAAAEHKRSGVARLEQTLKSQYAEKERALKEEMVQLQSEYDQRLLALKEQNLQLRENVAKLIGTMKNKRA